MNISTESPQVLSGSTRPRRWTEVTSQRGETRPIAALTTIELPAAAPSRQRPPPRSLFHPMPRSGRYCFSTAAHSCRVPLNSPDEVGREMSRPAMIGPSARLIGSDADVTVTVQIGAARVTDVVDAALVICICGHFGSLPKPTRSQPISHPLLLRGSCRPSC
jgi:hypothetical protein